VSVSEGIIIEKREVCFLWTLVSVNEVNLLYFCSNGHDWPLIGAITLLSIVNN